MNAGLKQAVFAIQELHVPGIKSSKLVETEEGHHISIECASLNEIFLALDEARYPLLGSIFINDEPDIPGHCYIRVAVYCMGTQQLNPQFKERVYAMWLQMNAKSPYGAWALTDESVICKYSHIVLDPETTPLDIQVLQHIFRMVYAQVLAFEQLLITSQQDDTVTEYKFLPPAEFRSTCRSKYRELLGVDTDINIQ